MAALGRLSSSACLAISLAACVHVRSVPQTPPPLIGNGYPENLALSEPAAQEVVVVINDNTEVVHAGMFVASRLLDPAGSYLEVRSREVGWTGVTLVDYVRFQLEDGPVVKLYRFALGADQYAQIAARVAEAGGTIPLFCAGRVQNILSGVAPFATVPNSWFVSPATLAGHLDEIIASGASGSACQWPDGASCNPQEILRAQNAGEAAR